MKVIQRKCMRYTIYRYSKEISYSTSGLLWPSRAAVTTFFKIILNINLKSQHIFFYFPMLWIRGNSIVRQFHIHRQFSNFKAENRIFSWSQLFTSHKPSHIVLYKRVKLGVKWQSPFKSKKWIILLDANFFGIWVN